MCSRWRKCKWIDGTILALESSLWENAGGVSVSYFEWIRNLSHIRFGRMERRYDELRGQHLISVMESLTNKTVPDWMVANVVRGADELDLVRSGLDDTMRIAFQELHDTLRSNDKVSVYRMLHMWWQSVRLRAHT